jgi:hypothetical protein
MLLMGPGFEGGADFPIVGLFWGHKGEAGRVGGDVREGRVKGDVGAGESAEDAGDFPLEEADIERVGAEGLEGGEAIEDEEEGEIEV